MKQNIRSGAEAAEDIPEEGNRPAEPYISEEDSKSVDCIREDYTLAEAYTPGDYTPADYKSGDYIWEGYISANYIPEAAYKSAEEYNCKQGGYRAELSAPY